MFNFLTLLRPPKAYDNKCVEVYENIMANQFPLYDAYKMHCNYRIYKIYVEHSQLFSRRGEIQYT